MGFGGGSLSRPTGVTTVRFGVRSVPIGIPRDPGVVMVGGERLAGFLMGNLFVGGGVGAGGVAGK